MRFLPQVVEMFTQSKTKTFEVSNIFSKGKKINKMLRDNFENDCNYFQNHQLDAISICMTFFFYFLRFNYKTHAINWYKILKSLINFVVEIFYLQNFKYIRRDVVYNGS